MRNEMMGSKRLVLLVLSLFILLMLGEAYSPRNNPQQSELHRLIRRGERLYAEGQYAEALVQFLEALKSAETPDELADVYYNLALGYFANQELRQSEDYLRRLFKAKPNKYINRMACPEDFLRLIAKVKGSPQEIAQTRVSELPAVKQKKKFPVLLVGLLAAGAGAGIYFLTKNGGGTPSSTSTPKGVIQVSSSPQGARIYLDGHDQGVRTNHTLTDINVGRHEIKLVLEGYVDYITNVQVSEGQTINVNKNLSRHTISVTRPNSSTVWTKRATAEIRWQMGSSQNQSGWAANSNPMLRPGYTGRHISPFNRMRMFHRISSGNRALGIGRTLRERASVDGRTAPPGDLKQDMAGLLRSQPLPHLPGSASIFPKHPYISGYSSGNSIAPAGYAAQGFDAASSDIKEQTLSNVKIQLFWHGKYLRDIIGSTPNGGVHSYLVPDNLMSDSYYKVKVSSTENSSINGMSDRFRVQAPPKVTYSNSTAVRIPDHNIANSYIKVYKHGKIIRVRYRIKISHREPNQLQVTLFHKMQFNTGYQKQVIIWNRRGTWDDGDLTGYINKDLDDRDMYGEWRVKIEDDVYGRDGTLNFWWIEIEYMPM